MPQGILTQNKEPKSQAGGPPGILSQRSDVKVEKNVKIDAPANSTKTHEAAPAPKEVTAPVVQFAIKDEVELLRQGIMNKHGEHVKPQGMEKK